MISSILNYILKSLMIHQVSTKEIKTVTVFGYLNLISIDFYDFIFTFSPPFSFRL